MRAHRASVESDPSNFGRGDIRKVAGTPLEPCATDFTTVVVFRGEVLPPDRLWVSLQLCS